MIYPGVGMMKKGGGGILLVKGEQKACPKEVALIKKHGLKVP